MKWYSAATAALALLASHAHATVSSEADKRKLNQRLKQAEVFYNAKKSTDALVELDAAIALTEFNTLPEETRAQVYAMAAASAREAGRHKEAYAHTLSGTKLKGAHVFLWQLRLGSELVSNRYADAVATVEAVASRSPDTLNEWPILWLNQLNNQVGKLPDKGVQRRLLVILTGPSYQPQEAAADLSGFRRDLASIKLEEGDIAGAKTLMAGVLSPRIMIRASTDPRLSSILPADFDVRALAEQRLAQLREIAVSHPGSMAAVLDIAQYLRMLGRAEESLATINTASPMDVQAAGFTDLDRQLNWWWDGLANSHLMLGHYDAAIAALRQGAKAKENSVPNVSQALNLAEVQLRFGHPEDALATLAPFEQMAPASASKKIGHSPVPIGSAAGRNMSPYGEMVYRTIHGSALFALGRAEEASGDVAYAAAHEKDNGRGLIFLQIYAGDMDAAAAALIRRLDDPDSRSEAIIQMSECDDPPVALPPDPFETGLNQLALRPDVKAAIARAGGVRRFHIQAAYV